MYFIYLMYDNVLEPRKHIALYQIHKIIVFLASSYDPFNNCFWPNKVLLTVLLFK